MNQKKACKDAERVIALSNKREALHRQAHAIKAADRIGVCDPTERYHGPLINRAPAFVFVHMTEELRALLMRELGEQNAEIEKEISELGFVPDQLEPA
jgi:hypothetical protein